jgi:NADH-quinone oxidoreductase subunit H
MLALIQYFLSSLLVILPLLLTMAYYTLLERKVMASLQRRYGPNQNGPWGLLQPILDGLKLLTSEIIVPTKANF